MMIGINITEQYGRAINRVDDDINLPFVEQVAKGRSTRRNDRCQTRSLDRRNIFEFPILASSVRDVVKEQRAFGEGRAPIVLVHLRVDVAVDHEEIEPAVVVVVQDRKSTRL